MAGVEITLFIIGLIFLVKGADLLVRGASSMADRLGVPRLVIGLTIVAFGTSMPELFINVFSATKGATDVAFGNIIGSSISNLLLILGISAMIIPLRIRHSTIWKEIPFALLATIVLFVVSNDSIIDQINNFSLSRADGLIMILFFSIFVFFIVESTRRNKIHAEQDHVKVPRMSKLKTTAFLIAGPVGLYFGGKWVVDGAISIAQSFGFSQFLISASIVSIGTTLPELTISIIAALKKDADLIVGNIIGSNIFNAFWVLGITSIIAPIGIPSFINTDLIFLALVTSLLFLFVFVGTRHELDKWQGLAFIILYITYMIFIIFRG